MYVCESVCVCVCVRESVYLCECVCVCVCVHVQYELLRWLVYSAGAAERERCWLLLWSVGYLVS